MSTSAAVAPVRGAAKGPQAALLDHASAAFFVTDARQHCTYMNPAAEALTGWTLPEVGGRPLHDVIHHSRPDGSRYPIGECPIDRAIPARHRIEGEEVFIHRDGSFFPVAFAASPLGVAGGQATGTLIELRAIARERAADAAAAAAARRTEDVLDAIGDGFITLDHRFRVTSINRAGLAMDGRPREAVVGRTQWELWPASLGTPVEAAYRRAMADRVPVELMHHFVSDREDVWMEIRAWPVAGGLALVYRDIGARLADQERLRESEARFRAFADHAPDAIYIMDAATRRLEYLSPAFERIWGEPRDATLRDIRRWAELVHPDDLTGVLARMPLLYAAGEPIVADYRIRRPDDGTVRHIRDTAVPIRDADGRIVRVIGLAHDATARKLAEGQSALLIRELNHRVKNTLATVQSIAAQTLGAGCEPAVRRGFEDRLISLARAHDVLTRSNWEGAELGEVAAAALGPHGGPAGARIAMAGPALLLSPKAALAISIALHELATNAAKYGALSVPDGRVALGWEVADGSLRLTWTEAGGPPVSPPVRRGFGTRLMERGLPHELQGRIRLDHLPGGLECELVAPLSALVRPPAAEGRAGA